MGDGGGGGLFSCITDSVSMIWSIPSSVRVPHSQGAPVRLIWLQPADSSLRPPPAPRCLKGTHRRQPPGCTGEPT